VRYKQGLLSWEQCANQRLHSYYVTVSVHGNLNNKDVEGIPAHIRIGTHPKGVCPMGGTQLSYF